MRNRKQERTISSIKMLNAQKTESESNVKQYWERSTGDIAGTFAVPLYESVADLCLEECAGLAPSSPKDVDGKWK